MSTTALSYKSKILSLDKAENSLFLVTIPAAYTGGTLQLGYAGQMSADIARYAAPADAQTAFEALELVGEGNSLFRWSPEGTWEIELIGDFAGAPTALVSADGTNLTPGPGEAVSVKMKRNGRGSYLTALVDEWWDNRAALSPDPDAPTELHYLYVRVDALTELRNIAWTQINQQEGDSKRDYEAQFSNLSILETETKDRILYLENKALVAAAATANQTFGGATNVKRDIFAQFGRSV